MSRAVVWVTLSGDKALVTGKGHDELVFQVAPHAKWSRAGKGWVVTLEQVADLCSLCEVERAVYRERRKP